MKIKKKNKEIPKNDSKHLDFHIFLMESLSFVFKDSLKSLGDTIVLV